MKINLAREIQIDSIVDGEGIRAVIWAQGCSHNCLGCHNPDTHDFKKGISYDVEEVKQQISELEIQDGLTFSGGDPFFQVNAFLELAKHAKKNKLNVWSYTGFTFEELLKMGESNPNIIKLLEHIDVLIDGRFVLSERSLDLKYRGSKNQRILNVKRSLKEKRACTIRKYQAQKSRSTKVYQEKKEFLYT